MDNTYTMMMKAQAQEFTDYLNSVDTGITWMTRWEVKSEIAAEDGDKELGTSVKQALAFLDMWLIVYYDVTIRQECLGKKYTLINISTLGTITLLSTREGWHKPCYTELRLW